MKLSTLAVALAPITLSATGLQASPVTIPVDVGPPGSSTTVIELPTDAFNNLSLDGSNLVLDVRFNRPLQIVADPATLTTESLEIILGLIHPTTASGSEPVVNTAELTAGSGDTVFTFTDLSLSERDTGASVYVANQNTISNQNELVFEGVTLDLVLVDDGTTATDALFQIGIEGPATLLVVAEPTSLALLLIGGLAATSQTRQRTKASARCDLSGGLFTRCGSVAEC